MTIDPFIKHVTKVAHLLFFLHAVSYVNSP